MLVFSGKEIFDIIKNTIYPEINARLHGTAYYNKLERG
jgi:hypothetical protein